MADPYTPYALPATLFLWQDGHDPSALDPDANCPCQWRAFDDPRVLGPVVDITHRGNLIELLVPVGTEIYTSAMRSTGFATRVAAVAPSQTWYSVLWVEVIYRGFPREVYKVLARRDHEWLDTPLP